MSRCQARNPRNALEQACRCGVSLRVDPGAYNDQVWISSVGYRGEVAAISLHNRHVYEFDPHFKRMVDVAVSSAGLIAVCPSLSKGAFHSAAPGWPGSRAGICWMNCVSLSASFAAKRESSFRFSGSPRRNHQLQMRPSGSFQILLDRTCRLGLNSTGNDLFSILLP